MKLAFCIFKYFPYGGLQRDMHRIAEIAHSRGHEVDIYTMAWKGEYPAGISVHIIRVKGWTNHSRALLFSWKLKKIFNHKAYDRIIGFNKMPNLDIYFTGESCFAKHVAQKSTFFMRYLPRYCIFSWLEKKVFKKNGATEILLISPKEKENYQKFYQTNDARFHFFPPAIDLLPFNENQYITIRQRQRELHNIAPNKIWILFVASDYALKGLDRALDAIFIMDNDIYNKVVFSIIGDDNASPYKTYITKHNIKTRIDFLGASDSVQLFMCGADLLLHPAKLELAGKVLLEALINKLPVCTTNVCGCSTYIVESQGGEVLPEPFSLTTFIETLQKILDALQKYKNKLTHYKIDPNIYQSHQHLVKCIETLDGRHNSDFYLNEHLMRHLPQEKNACINIVFSLKGKMYRQVKNRTTISTTIGEEEYFIKMHRGVGWKEILKNIAAFKSVALGAKQEYNAIREMKKAGILVPTVCAYATSGINPARIRSFIATKKINYQYDLEKLCQTWSTNPPHFIFKRKLIHRVAEITRKMHENGMNHRDLYLCHFLLNAHNKKNFDIYLIDLHRVQIRKKVPLRWRAKDLAGLYFSAMNIGLSKNDEYYFLTCYYNKPLRIIFKHHRWICFWIYWRARRLYRRHYNKYCMKNRTN